MAQTTHLRIDPALVGEVIAVTPGQSVVRLLTLPVMVADDRGLVHGGFIFGLADYAAMLAINDPNVVLGSSEVRFVAPVKVGEKVEARAQRVETKGRKGVVAVIAAVGDRTVLEGTFTTFTLDKHVLDR